MQAVDQGELQSDLLSSDTGSKLFIRETPPNLLANRIQWKEFGSVRFSTDATERFIFCTVG